MKQILNVAHHEFFSNVRKPSFLFALFGLPALIGVIFGVVIFASSLAAQSGEISGDSIGYVDETGWLADSINRPESFSAIADTTQAEALLRDRTLEAYFVLTPRYAQSGNVALYANGNVSRTIEREIEAFIKANLVASTDSTLPAERLQDPVTMTIFLQDSGRSISSTALVVLFIIPMMFVMMFMMALQFSSSFLMSSIVEEKTNRIMEILITSMTPMELLTGKVLGLGLIGLLQVFVWVAIGAIGLVLGRTVEGLDELVIPPDLVMIALVYFLLNYFLYGGLLAGVGAIVDSEQESRQYAGFVSLLIVIPVFFISEFILNPNSGLAVALSIIPFTSGMAMLLRVAFGVVPAWQLALSFGLTLATTLLIIWASAKVFRWGILLYGKRITPLEIWRVIRSRRTVTPQRS